MGFWKYVLGTPRNYALTINMYVLTKRHPYFAQNTSPWEKAPSNRCFFPWASILYFTSIEVILILTLFIIHI